MPRSVDVHHTTDVAIIGAGPSGLLLSQLLHLDGISSIVVERQSRAHVEGRIRAGVLEQGTVDVLKRAGVGDRLLAEGQRHSGFSIGSDGDIHRIALTELTGKHVTVYGQTEVTRDLMNARERAGGRIFFNAAETALHDIETDQPSVSFTDTQGTHRIAAKFIAGCDGFHGPSRQAIPDAKRRAFERVYPFGWLGILADVPPCQDELIYAASDNGFALASMRSPTRSRYYIQCRTDDNVAAWPDDRLWEELKIRLGPAVAANITTGPAIEKSIAPLRSFVCEPMQCGRLFLAGDAAHIVPPTGAKGLNLAVGDIHYLSTALAAWFASDDDTGLVGYSQTALRRVWKTERFSWMMTALLHDFRSPTPTPSQAFEHRMSKAERDYLFSSRAAQMSIAENYVGLPYHDEHA